MAIKVNIDFKGVQAKINRLSDAGQAALADQVHADSNRYAPFKRGDLRVQSQVTADNKAVIWNVPYARRQYYNIGANFSEPGTGPKWYEKARSIHLKSWQQVVERSLK